MTEEEREHLVDNIPSPHLLAVYEFTEHVTDYARFLEYEARRVRTPTYMFPVSEATNPIPPNCYVANFHLNCDFGFIPADSIFDAMDAVQSILPLLRVVSLLVDEETGGTYRKDGFINNRGKEWMLEFGRGCDEVAGMNMVAAGGCVQVLVRNPTFQ